MTAHDRCRWAALAAVAVLSGCGRTELPAGRSSDSGGGGASSASSLSTSSSMACVPDGEACEPAVACCGSACVRGVCKASRCQAGDAPVVLAEGLEWPIGPVVDREHVFFVSYAEAGAIYRASKDDGQAERLAEADWPHDIALDDTFLYVTTETAVLKMRKDGSERSVLARTFGGAGIALRTDAVVWAEYFGRSVKSVPRGGGATTVLAALGSSPFRLITQGEDVYFAGLGLGLYRLSPGAEAPELLLDRHVRSIATDETFAYVTVNLGSEHTIVRQPLDGGPAETLTEHDTYVDGVVVDGASMYVSANGGVYRTARDGGVLESVYVEEGLIAGLLALDESCLYLPARTGLDDAANARVVRLPRE